MSGGDGPGPPTSLRRGLAPATVVVLALAGLSPAASVYITGSAVLKLAGTGAAAALLLGALAQVVAALLYAELGSAFPRSGGVYPGITAVLGARAGFVALVLGLVTAPAFIAFVALGLADYVGVLAPGASRPLIVYGALAAAAGAASLSVRTDGWITGALLTAELGAVLLPPLAGLHPVRGLGEALLHPVRASGVGGLAPTSPGALALAAVAGSYACSGSMLAINFADELRGPGRRIGAVVLTVALVGGAAVTAPMVVIALSARDLAAVLGAPAPAAAFLAAQLGPQVTAAVLAVVAVGVFNNLIAALLAYSRFLHATATDGWWPKPLANGLARTHPRLGSPVAAVAVLVMLAALAAPLGARTLLIFLSGEIFTALLVVAAVVRGRRTGATGAAGFRSPFFPLAPAAGVVIIAAIAAADIFDPTSGRISLALLAMVAIGAAALFRDRGAPSLP